MAGGTVSAADPATDGAGRDKAGSSRADSGALRDDACAAAAAVSAGGAGATADAGGVSARSTAERDDDVNHATARITIALARPIQIR